MKSKCSAATKKKKNPMEQLEAEELMMRTYADEVTLLFA